MTKELDDRRITIPVTRYRFGIIVLISTFILGIPIAYYGIPDWQAYLNHSVDNFFGGMQLVFGCVMITCSVIFGVLFYGDRFIPSISIGFKSQ